MKKYQIDDEELIQMYQTGLSCQKIANKLEVSESFISKKLVNLNVKKRDNKYYRKRKFNDNFFDIIDTEDKAYWLGFLYADGCVRIRNKNQYIISFAVKDKEIIEKFINSIEADFSVKTYNEVHCVNLTSKIMFESLFKHGCIPNKSLVLKFPTTIKYELISHFVRGYFDGDGSVYYTNPKNNNKTKTIYKNISINICGTIEFLTELNSVLSLNCSIYKEKRRLTNTYSLRLSGTNKCKKFYEFTYLNSNLFLTRKKEKFENYFKERGSTTTIS